MPTYDYTCKACNHRFEAFQSMRDPALTACPACGQESVQRLIGTGAGLVFKGNGFYLTDYKKRNGTESLTSPSSPAETGNSVAAKSDSSTSTTPSVNTTVSES
jgi:putative FmdB family regulatory protein